LHDIAEMLRTETRESRVLYEDPRISGLGFTEDKQNAVGIDRLDDDNDTSDGYWLMTIVVRAFFITEIRLN